MGKAAITRATTKLTTGANSPQMKKSTKKKGRPDIQKQRELKALTPSPKFDTSLTSRRSSRRRNSVNYSFVFTELSSDDFEDEDDDDDDEDDDERKEKKVKLVVRLPQSNQLHSQNSSCQNSGSTSDSEPEREGHDASLNGDRINFVHIRSSDAVTDQGKQALEVTDTVHGSPLECRPTTPLPDKKLLLFILDKLQKKDTRGVYAQPVDLDELPDYLEYIEHPMDFGTVRKKLDGGGYSNLEELEADIFLICSNAMEYNSTGTVYYRQARSIQELAKRYFANLRHEGDDSEPKLMRGGSPSKNVKKPGGSPSKNVKMPSKNVKMPNEGSPADHAEYSNVKKPFENPPSVDCTDIQLSSGATLISGEDTADGSNAYNFKTNYGSRNGENYSDCFVDWNSEFPDMKYGKKQFSMDDYRRDTYNQHQLSDSANGQPYLSNTSGDTKQLIVVGLHLEPHVYARSLARYAADLGPVAWKVASMKIRSVVPDGIHFGPGWVGEDDTPSQTSSFACEKQKPMNRFIDDHDAIKPVTHVPGLSSTVAYRPQKERAEAVKRMNHQNKLVENDGLSWRRPVLAFHAQEKPVSQHGRRNDGFNGMFRHDVTSQTGMSKRAPAIEERSTSYQMRGCMLPESEVSPMTSGPFYQSSALESTSRQHYGNLFGQAAPEPLVERSVEMANRFPHQVSSMQHIPLDLNVRVPASGSPQQPDLALQL